MPNWCFNKVKISGSKANLKRIEKVLKRCKKDRIFFDRIFPIPKSLRDTETSSRKPANESFQDMFKPGYEFKNWYDWCVVNWGTKWDAEIFNMDIKADCILIDLHSAWSPPVAFFKKFSEIFGVTVELRYIEDALFYIGKSILKNGNLLLEDNRTDISRQTVEHFGFDSDIFFGDDE